MSKGGWREGVAHYSLLVALALLAALPAGRARAAVRVTTGPYLQDASATGVSLLWRVDTASVPAVEFRPASGADAQWRTVTGDRSRSPVVSLSGLSAATTYQYRLRADGDVVGEGTFRTLSPPTSDTLNFVVYGDNRTNHGPHGDVVRQILKEQPVPELLVQTGDLVEHGGNADEWNTYFQIERDLLARVPMFPALGNHEDNAGLYFEQFKVPANGTSDGKGRWYSYDAGPAHFVALDVVFSPIDVGTPQYRWLDADLARTDRPWKFVYFHYPPYNASTPHGPNVVLRNAIENLFLQRKVSAVFTGHAHTYERAAGAGIPQLQYFVSGGGGAPQHTPGRDPSTRYTEVSYHFLRVLLRGDRIVTTGVRTDGTEFDRFEGRLNSEGRVDTVSAAPQQVLVPGMSAAQYARTPQGGLFAGYVLLMAVAVPLGASVGVGVRRSPVVPVPSGPVYRRREAVSDSYVAWRGLPSLAVVAAVMVALLVILGATAPLKWLIGFNTYSVLLTAHAVSGVAMVIVAAAAGNYGYRLAAHHAPSFRFLASNAAGAVGLSFTLAVLGNVLYARYIRSGGPMEQLIRKAPEAHRILFEFKEFAGLAPLPLAVSAAFIIFRYREDLRRDRHLAELVAFILLLLAFYCLFPLALGASITRLRGIV